MKRLVPTLLAAVILLGCAASAVGAAITPVFSVAVTAAPEDVSGRLVLTVDWSITANEPNIQLRGGSGLRLAYDSTVLQLIAFSGGRDDYMLSETLSVMSAASRLGGYEDAMLDIRASQNASGSIGYVTIELGHPQHTCRFDQGQSQILASIRFAFRDGKSPGDLSEASIRLMTIEELERLVQPAALNLSVAARDTNIDYVYRSRSIADSLDEPMFNLAVDAGGGNSAKVPSGTGNPSSISDEPPAIRSSVEIVAPAWAKDAVDFILAQDLVVGLESNLFDATKKAVRGEFVATLMRAYGIAPEPTATDNFDDVDGDAAYAPYISTAKKYRITVGIGENKFAPEQQITREEMFVLLYNTLTNLGELPKKSANGKTLSGFFDVNQVATWAVDAMEALLQAGMIDGTGHGELSPKLLCDRSTMAQMIYNLLTRQ